MREHGLFLENKKSSKAYNRVGVESGVNHFLYL